MKDSCKKHQRTAKKNIVSGASLVEPEKINADDMTTTSKLYSVIRKIIAPSHPPSAASINFKEKDVNMLKEEFNRLYNNNNNNNEPIAKKELEQLTILLDKMLSRGYITSQEHEMLSKNLSEKFEKKNEEENKLQSLIQTTFQYVIKHDKDELKKLLLNYSDKKFVQLVDAFLFKEYDDIDGEEIYPKLYDLISHSVEATPLIKDKIHQLNIQMLLRDINDNRYRVKTILTRLYNDQSQQNYNFLATLNRLFYEDLLSQKQYDEMKDLGGNNNNNNLQSIANIVKGTKYGQGLKFLPREVADLKNEFQTLITKVASEGINKLEKNLMAAYLNELSKQKVITKHECNSIKKDVCS